MRKEPINAIASHYTSIMTFPITKSAAKSRYLLIFHEPLIAAGPKSPRVAVDDVSDEDLSVDVNAELDLHVDEGAVPSGPEPLQDFEDREGGALHDLVLVPADGHAVELPAGGNDLGVGPEGIVVLVVLEARFLERRVESVALVYSRVPLEEAAGSEPPGDPLDRYHLAAPREEGFVAGQLDEGRLDTGLVEQLEDLRVGDVADRSLALELVRLSAIAGCYAVLALQVAELWVGGVLEDLLGLALDYELT